MFKGVQKLNKIQSSRACVELISMYTFYPWATRMENAILRVYDLFGQRWDRQEFQET